MQKYGNMANYFAPTHVNVIYWEKKQRLFLPAKKYYYFCKRKHLPKVGSID